MGRKCCKSFLEEMLPEPIYMERSAWTFHDEADHDAFFVQTCVEEVENAEYATPQKHLFSMRGEEPLDEGLDPRSRLREYVDSKRRAVAKRLCYARPTRSSWPLKQGSSTSRQGCTVLHHSSIWIS